MPIINRAIVQLPPCLVSWAFGKQAKLCTIFLIHIESLVIAPHVMLPTVEATSRDVGVDALILSYLDSPTTHYVLRTQSFLALCRNLSYPPALPP